MALATIPERRLDDLAAELHRVWGQTKVHQVAAWEGYFATGRLLGEARARFTDNQSYGRWFGAQGFGFSTEWARRLMMLADRETDVRALPPFATGVADAVDLPGINAVLAMLNGRQSGRRGGLPERGPAEAEAVREYEERRHARLGCWPHSWIATDSGHECTACNYVVLAPATRLVLPQPSVFAARGHAWEWPPSDAEYADWLAREPASYEDPYIRLGVAVPPPIALPPPLPITNIPTDDELIAANGVTFRWLAAMDDGRIDPSNRALRNVEALVRQSRAVLAQTQLEETV